MSSTITPGTPLTDTVEKPAQLLSTRDVCAILRSCLENRVVSLKFAGLEVEFSRGDSPEAPVTPFPYSGPVAVKRPTKKAEKRTEEERRQALVQAEVSLKEQVLEQLAIEDPLAYERFLADEDSERIRDQGDDEDSPEEEFS